MFFDEQERSPRLESKYLLNMQYVRLKFRKLDSRTRHVCINRHLKSQYGLLQPLAGAWKLTTKMKYRKWSVIYYFTQLKSHCLPLPSYNKIGLVKFSAVQSFPNAFHALLCSSSVFLVLYCRLTCNVTKQITIKTLHCREINLLLITLWNIKLIGKYFKQF